MKKNKFLFLLTIIAFSTNSYANAPNNKNDETQEKPGSQHSQIAYDFFSLHKDENIFLMRKKQMENIHENNLKDYTIVNLTRVTNITLL